MIKSISALLRRFHRDTRGVSAVEFALLAPVIAGVFLSMAEIGHVAYQRTDMHSALRAGGQYVLNGGRDVDVAREIALRAWTSMPEDGEVAVTRYCLCGGAEHVCNAPCSDGSVPEAYLQLTASATLGGVVVTMGEHAEDAIRIR